jgi:MFS family permease
MLWLVGSIAFAYAYFQRVAPSVMVETLMSELAVSAAVLGNLSAIYFYAYATSQIPIGIALDRKGVRPVFTAALVLAAIGSVTFALAQSVFVAYLGRLGIGLGCAVAFVATLKLISEAFPRNWFGMLSGLTMCVAMTGAVTGQAPLALFIETSGWRLAMLVGGALALVLAVAIWLLAPGSANTSANTSAARRELESETLWAGIRRVAAKPQLWLITLYCSTAAAPIFAYAALWGVPHLIATYNLSNAEAGGLTSLCLIGWAAGSPAIGLWSDRTGQRKRTMLLTAVANLLLWCFIIYAQPASVTWVAGALFLAGFMTGGAVVAYAAGCAHCDNRDAGSASAMVNTGAVGAGAILQPIVGWTLDRLQAGSNGVYEPAMFQWSFVWIIASVLLACVLALLVEDAPTR